ncbi:MAG: Archaeal ATPase [Bacteroidetes bacterium ADurb.Bin012]|nr:MAG: Archaeal ATPase [Bacteroidetes bacterium ADurb.Bin012]
MKRKISKLLSEWKTNPKRMPLIINGARQVGKTYIIKQFGKEQYEHLLYLNLEIEDNFCKFLETELSPDKIIQYLEAAKGVNVNAGNTLIFFDEIQVCEQALTSLKYFCEQAPEQHVIAAGSLLGVSINRNTINRNKHSFPVGKVQQINMYPMDFEEFLWAMDREKLSEEIKAHFDEDLAMPNALHEIALKYHKQFMIVGGMPAAVSSFIETGSYNSVQLIQNDIAQQYIADMSKYATSATSVKIRACYNSIPAQLAKDNRKFQYKTVQRGGTATIFGEAIDWLQFAGIVLKCQRLEHGFIPLNAYADLSNYKLYMADIGILTLHSRIPLQTMLSPIEVHNIFLGSMAENYVAQAFVNKGYDLFYWQSEGKAEIDFVLQIQDSVIPVEVKKGHRNRSRSLGIFANKYKSPYAIRISKKNFGFENNIKSVPLYAVFCI